LSRDHDLLKKLGKIYSANPDTLPVVGEKLIQEKAELSKENEQLRLQLMEVEAEELLRDAPQKGHVSIVRKVFTGRSLESLKILAQKLTLRPGVLVFFAASDAGQIVVARSKELTGSCGEAIKRLTAQRGGKGGGRPEFAQAGGLAAESLDAGLTDLETLLVQPE
jgi:alanyl-tRNA synthetase